MGIHISKSAQFALAVIYSSLVAACAPLPIDTETLGKAATGEEIKAHFSGKSIRLTEGANNTQGSESYFASDGTYMMVAINVPQHSTGRWGLGGGQGQSENTLFIVENFTDVRGRKKIEFTRQFYFKVHITPDGSATIIDVATGRGRDIPRPTRGFPLEGRFNNLKRQASNL